MKERILKLLCSYMKIGTDTGTGMENEIERFYDEWFKNIKDADKFGKYEIDKDILGRKIYYAFQKGNTNKTVVLMHHYDTVNTDTYGNGREFAREPEKIKEFFKKEGKDLLDDDAIRDLYSEDWIFGRGSCDMKGGGAIQLAIFEKFFKIKNKPNILLTAVPDEENLSMGARFLPYLLYDLKKEFNLEYSLMIDSEPHDRNNEDEFVLHRGSIGKVLFAFVIKGKLSHIGEYYQGINPIKIMAKFIEETEGNLDFTEKTPVATYPPAWLRARDDKTYYDVSLPETTSGALSVFLLEKSPHDVAEILKGIAENSMDFAIDSHNKSMEKYSHQTGLKFKKIEKGKVCFFSELWDDLNSEDKKEILSEDFENFSLLDKTIKIMGSAIKKLNADSPLILIGIAPPYNPPVISDIGFLDEIKKTLFEEFNLKLRVEDYFMGISDLSFSKSPNREDSGFIKYNMPIDFEIPEEIIKKISMPGINLGPWGKSLHKIGERVNIKDLTEVVPGLIFEIIKNLL